MGTGEQANRSFGLFDGFMPSRASFESGASQLMGGPCEYNCAGNDASVKSTADVFEGSGKAVLEVGNRYYPELAKTVVLAALPGGTAVKGAEVAGTMKVSELVATHGRTMSNKQLDKLIKSIRQMELISH